VSAQVQLPYQVVTPVEAEKIRAFVRQLIVRLEEATSQGAVAISTDLPTTGNETVFAVGPLSDSSVRAARVEAGVSQVTPGYFQVLKIPIVAGRAFLPVEDERAALAAVTDETLAKALFGRTNAVGQRISLQDISQVAVIVGVVGDVRQAGRAIAQRPQLYLPFSQLPLAHLALLVRTPQPSGVVAKEIRAAVRRVDPVQPVTSIRPLEDVVYDEVRQPRFYAITLFAFAAAALAIAASGLSATVAAMVVEQRREIGVRLALGARTKDVLLVIVRRMTLVIVIGMGAGIILAILSVDLLRSLFATISNTSSPPILSAAVILVAAAAVATAVPARRAIRIDPWMVLRGY
jgi:putative ABC transport system permease protein